MATLESKLADPKLLNRVVTAFMRVADKQRRGTTPLTAFETDVKEAEHRLGNITEALAKVGYSEAVIRQVQVEEENAARARTRLADATKSNRPKVIPHPKAVEGYVTTLLKTLGTDTVKARERPATAIHAAIGVDA